MYHFKSFLFISIVILCALVFCLHICPCEVVAASGTGAADSYELQCRCWEWNPGPLEEHPSALNP